MSKHSNDWVHLFLEGRMGYKERQSPCKGVGKLVCDAVTSSAGGESIFSPFTLQVQLVSATRGGQPAHMQMEHLQSYLWCRQA